MTQTNSNEPGVSRGGGAMPPNLAWVEDDERDDAVIDDEQMEARYDELERQQAIGDGCMWNDAVMIGDFDTPEMQAALGATTAVLTAKHHRVPGKNWSHKKGSLREILDSILTRHPVEKEKHGSALSYGVSKGRRKHTGAGGNEKRFAPRLKDEIEAIYSFAVDVDGSEKAMAVRDRLTAAGYLVVLYTTHSHAAKKTEKGDRFRVVIFFKEPFVFPHPSANMRKLPKDQQQARVDAIKLYEAIYTGIAEEIVGLDDFDGSGMKLNQIQHPPRRPADADEWFHYVIAGELLDWKDAPQGDASKYRKSEPRVSGNHADLTGRKTGEPAILSDGFDVRAWWEDYGELISVEHVLDMLGWETRGSSNGGMTMLCANDANHSTPGDENDTGCWAKGDGDGEDRFVITCQHAHCYGICTWDHIKLMEDAFLAGEAVLPDEYRTLSEALCDPSLYPDEVDGEEVEPPQPSDFGAEVAIEIAYLASTRAVKKAFKAALGDDHAGDDHFAALYAGVAKSGNKQKVREKLDELMLTIKDRFDGNARRRLKKRGEEMLKADKATFAAKKAEEEQAQAEKEAKDEKARAVEAIQQEDLAHPSMDPADPLGDDLQSSLATLGKRYSVADVNGKFRVVRKPDLDAFGSDVDSTMVYYTKQDFIDLHLDRQVSSTNARGDKETVNPAKVFLEVEPRKSGVVFAPPPISTSANSLNLYQGRKLRSKAGEWPVLEDFLLTVICKGDNAKLDWLLLWMAHMVQRPGEKPGTAVVCRGEGRTGKGTFGAILTKLAAPHVKELSQEAHVTGQFAGEHLSKCILAIVTEAVFGGDRKVSNVLKAMVTQPTIEVEAKGMNLVTVPSYLRLYIDSNSAAPVMIEGNGSEKRYFVLESGTIHKADTDYFAKVYDAIEGDEMAALLDYLENYDPVEEGQTWGDVRLAPDTPERREMAVVSMRAPKRRLLEVLREGHVTLQYDGEMIRFEGAGPRGNEEGLRVPITSFRAYIAAVGDSREATDADVCGMFESVFPELTVMEKRGRMMIGGQGQDGVRFWEFPPEALGDENVSAALALTNTTDDNDYEEEDAQ